MGFFISAHRDHKWERAWIGSIERDAILNPRTAFTVVFVTDWDTWSDTGPVGYDSSPSVLSMLGVALPRDHVKPDGTHLVSAEETKCKCWSGDTQEEFTVRHPDGPIVGVTGTWRGAALPWSAEDISWNALTGILLFIVYPSHRRSYTEYKFDFRKDPRPRLTVSGMELGGHCHHANWGWVVPFAHEFMPN